MFNIIPRAFLLTISLLLLVGTALVHAATNPLPPSTAPSNTMPAPNPVISPDSFAAQVQSAHQQTLSNLSQQVGQQFTKRPLPSNPIPGTTDNKTPTPATAPPAPPSTSISNAPTQSAASSYAPQPPAYAPAPTSGAQAPQVPQAPAYSGFGTGKPNSPNTPPPSNNSNSNTGWGIQY